MRGIVVLVSLYCLQQFLRCNNFISGKEFGNGTGYGGSCSISAGTSKGSGKAWGEAVPEFDRTI